MAQSERLLALLQSLRARRAAVSAATLAREFGVSERTIYRDLALLVRRGAAVEGAAGVGYVLRPGHFLPPLMLDSDEADAVMLGLRFVMRRGDDALAYAARSALSKVATVLPSDVALGARLNGLVVAPIAATDDDRGSVAMIRACLRSEHKLHIAYRDGDDHRSERIVWPVALGFFDGLEMLAAWCELRDGFRHFRIDRIETIERSSERLPTPHRILLAEYRTIERGVEC